MSPASLAWIPRFLKHLSIERRLSAHTDSNYKRDLERFVAWCDHDRIRRLARSRQSAHSHVRRRRVPARRLAAHDCTTPERPAQLLQFLIREGELRANPANEIKAPKASKRLPETIDVDQMTRLLSFRTDEQLGVRDKAIMELFYSSGLRLAELVGLDLTDVDLAIAPCGCLAKAARRASCPSADMPQSHRPLVERARNDRRNRRARVVRRASRRAAATTHRAGARGELGEASGPPRACSSAHVSAFLRNAPARIEPGPARRPGAARPREYCNHAGLHPP